MVSLQVQIYNRGRESYHNHKHSQTCKNFFLNILFLILILDLPYCQMVVIQYFIMLLILPILILSIFTQGSSNTVKETLVFKNILYRDATAFLT